MLYSINYHHEGDSKTWYGIAIADAPKYETVMCETLFPETAGKYPHHVWAKSSLVEPSVLAAHGVKIVSCVQNPGDFVLTSPGGYHQGFCHGAAITIIHVCKHAAGIMTERVVGNEGEH